MDRFKPAMPRIPGVSSAEQETSAPTTKRERPARIAAALAAALALGAAIGWFALHGSRVGEKPSTPSRANSNGLLSSAPTAASAATTRGPDGVHVIASVQELVKPWSSKRFLFRKPFTDELVPAIVVRLPGSSGRSGGYWAFSLQAPFRRCELEFVTDLAKLSRQYSHPARYPMVADPCSGTIYDPLRLGTVPGGAWARGEVVRGAALRPPMEIEVRVQGNHLVATRME